MAKDNLFYYIKHLSEEDVHGLLNNLHYTIKGHANKEQAANLTILRETVKLVLRGIDNETITTPKEAETVMDTASKSGKTADSDTMRRLLRVLDGYLPGNYDGVPNSVQKKRNRENEREKGRGRELERGREHDMDIENDRKGKQSAKRSRSKKSSDDDDDDSKHSSKSRKNEKHKKPKNDETNNKDPSRQRKHITYKPATNQKERQVPDTLTKEDEDRQKEIIDKQYNEASKKLDEINQAYKTATKFPKETFERDPKAPVINRYKEEHHAWWLWQEKAARALDMQKIIRTSRVLRIRLFARAKIKAALIRMLMINRYFDETHENPNDREVLSHEKARQMYKELKIQIEPKAIVALASIIQDFLEQTVAKTLDNTYSRDYIKNKSTPHMERRFSPELVRAAFRAHLNTSVYEKFDQSQFRDRDRMGASYTASKPSRKERSEQSQLKRKQAQKDKYILEVFTQNKKLEKSDPTRLDKILSNADKHFEEIYKKRLEIEKEVKQAKAEKATKFQQMKTNETKKIEQEQQREYEQLERSLKDYPFIRNDDEQRDRPVTGGKKPKIK